MTKKIYTVEVTIKTVRRGVEGREGETKEGTLQRHQEDSTWWASQTFNNPVVTVKALEERKENPGSWVRWANLQALPINKIDVKETKEKLRAIRLELKRDAKRKRLAAI